MKRSRWDNINDLVRNKFKVEKETMSETEIEKGLRKKEETIVFQSPKGKMKIIRLVKPKVEDVKYHYSRRTDRGSRQKIQYSATDTVEIIKLYRLDVKTGDWEEINFLEL